jgi:hypothetical protein
MPELAHGFHAATCEIRFLVIRYQGTTGLFQMTVVA